MKVLLINFNPHTDNLVEICKNDIVRPFWEIYKEFRKMAAMQKGRVKGGVNYGRHKFKGN